MSGLDAAITATLAIVIAGLALLVAHRSPRLAFVAALCLLCFVPVWFGARLGFNGNLLIPVAVLACLAIALVMLPVTGMRASPVDALLVFLVVVATSSFLTSDPVLALSFLVTPFAYFVSGYLVGRIATARIGAETVYRVVAIVFTLVAVLALVEFVTGVNLFIALRIDNSLFSEWGDIQSRGGYDRAEGAFGHSIALGSSLALAVPLALAARFPFAVRLGMVSLMLAATVVTFSRIGIICAFFGVALCALLLREQLSRLQRGLIVVGGSVIAVLLLPLVVAVFTEAGDEAVNSASYRGDLFPLLASANLVGFSDSVHRSPSGSLTFGSFVSIDSQLVLTGLTSGLLALAAVAVAVTVAIILCLRGRAQPATVAVVAQLPALATVALITQYSVMLWLIVGVAATSQSLLRAAPGAVPAVAPSAVLAPLRLRTAPIRLQTSGD